jgi:membrane protein DedA with SNARE-associated domain
MAGAGKMQFLRFLSFIGIGALLFISMVVGAGRIFHDEVTYIVGMLANVRKYGHFIMLAIFVLYLLAPLWRRPAFMRQFLRASGRRGHVL